MIEEVRLRGLGVISEAVLEFSPGLTVVTGETGAGKTMVVTGLGLLLGGRADAGAVRAGESSAGVEGHFIVAGDGPVATRAEGAGADMDPLPDGLRELIVSRTVGANGRGRAHLGGRAVPVATLADLADDLVAVHGQSEQILLRSPERQRQLVDRFGGDAVDGPLTAYRSAWQRFSAVDAELTEITEQATARRQQAELLRAGLEEIEAVAPQPGEDVELKALSQRLEHAEELRRSTTSAHAHLVGEEDATQPVPDVLELVEAARREVEGAAAFDEKLSTLAARLAEIGYMAGDVAAELATYLGTVDADPAGLSTVHERRAELTTLTRRYGEDVDAVLTWAQDAAVRLHELDRDDVRVDELRAEHARLDVELTRLAGELTAARTAAGGRLSSAVADELEHLAMGGARLTVDVRPRERGPHGADDVTLLLAPHSGAPDRPLSRGASGGELSRVMLALEVALAGLDPVPTFVFDEVDAGVGGKAAVEIGRRLSTLAESAQVVVVTHLAQVAAFADRHLVVVKSDDGRVTQSDVTTVEGEDRVRELARMLAGQEDSDTARAHAAELLVQAQRV